MITQERYDALMQVSIDPKLFRSHEASVCPELAQDPHRHFDELRAKFGDVMEVKDNCIDGVEFPTLTPMNPENPGVLVTGFDTVKEVLTNQNNFFQNYGQSMDILMGESQIAGLNPPGHKSFRTLISQAFNKGSVDQLQTEVIVPLMTGLIEKFAQKETAELVEDFTCIMPTLLIGEIFQLPIAQYNDFAKLVAGLMNFNADWDGAVAASQGFSEIFIELIEERKLAPGNDLISRMLDAELDGVKLNDTEMMSFCRALVPAGVETTTRALSSVFSLLLNHPHSWEALRNDPDLVPAAVEEVIRFSGPVMMLPKRTTRDLELAGKKLRKDTNIWVCIGHANRDPAIWTNPHDFDITRKRKPHLGFSIGVHMCIGNQLARREMQDALRLMLEKLPNMRLNPDVPTAGILGVQHRSADRIEVLTGVSS